MTRRSRTPERRRLGAPARVGAAALRWLRPVMAFTLMLLSFGAAAAEGLRIGVATMQPGEIFFERFGHNAIVVDDPARGAISYNFGFFDPTDADFHARFLRGDMRYRLVALPLEDDLAYYREVGRGVSLQWLALTPEEASDIAAALAENARPENAHYRYDYFLDNCSTRVRDALDRALGGLLRRRLETRSQGNTFRSEAVRLASPAWWMWLGFDLGLGPAADRPNSLWRDAFVPMRLADSLRELRRDDGRALVSEEVELLPHRLAPEPAESPRPWWPWALAGAAFALWVLRRGARAPRQVAAVALPLWTLAGVAGVLMLAIWTLTAHRFGWANHNLLLLSPLCLGLLPGAWRIARGRAPKRVFGVLLAIVALGAVLAPFLHWLPLQPQRNAHWIALLAPVQLALAWTLWRAPRALSD